MAGRSISVSSRATRTVSFWRCRPRAPGRSVFLSMRATSRTTTCDISSTRTTSSLKGSCSSGRRGSNTKTRSSHIASMTRSRLLEAARHLASRDRDLRRILKLHRPTPLWARKPGFRTLIQIILEQQVSLASARAVFRRLARVDGARREHRRVLATVAVGGGQDDVAALPRGALQRKRHHACKEGAMTDVRSPSMTGEPINDAGEYGSPDGMGTLPRLGVLVADALRYWELRRLVYNFVLGVVVVAHLASAWPASMSFLKVENLLGLFILAVLANVAYCAAYVADLFVQLSGLRAAWLRWRWLLLALGTAFAAVLTHFFSQGMFTASFND